MEIGDKLKKLRHSKEVSQGDIAKHANISRQYVSDLERNRTSPSIKTLNKIAEYFNVDPSFFIDKKEDDWYEALPQELKEFVKKENIQYLEIGLKAKENGWTPEAIHDVIETISKYKN